MTHRSQYAEQAQEVRGVRRHRLVTIPPELLDQPVQGPMTPEKVLAVCLRFKKALIERAMSREMVHHLGYHPGEACGRALYPSARPYRGLEYLDYPFHDHRHIVTRCGRICFSSRKINLSAVFAGRRVSARQVADQI